MKSSDGRNFLFEEMLIKLLTGNLSWRLLLVRPTTTRWSNRQHDEKEVCIYSFLKKKK